MDCVFCQIASGNIPAHVFRIANRIAKALKIAHPSEGPTLFQANRPAGLQTVPHFHLHILPRNPDDGVDLACLFPVGTYVTKLML